MKELFIWKVAAGEVIFKEGAAGKCMYHIHKGKVGIYSRYQKKDEKCLAILSAEDMNPYFGEMALIDGMARSATAVALEDCELGEVAEYNLRLYFQKHPELIIDMLQRMSGRLRILTYNYVDACRTIAQQETERNVEKKPEAEWIQKLKKYVAISEDPPTDAEIAAMAADYAAKWDLPQADTATVLEAKKIPAGTVIFRKGDMERCMYELVHGMVAIYTDYGLSTQEKLTTLSAGEEPFFGEMGLIDSAPRSASAVAQTDCTILTIDAENMQDYFLNDPEKLLAIMRQMSGRIRELTKKYMDAVRTIAENQRYGQSGENKPEWLTNSLKSFEGVWETVIRVFGVQK